MFFISNTNDKIVTKKIVDTQNRVAGFILNGKFIHFYKSRGLYCDPAYENGFLPVELEHISETIQRNKMAK